ncbi:uncharacterized protein LOC133195484 isoform X2 [Saccostrea echinata]|uniref:uncharacterized protein LOC133195484 isoform X2 n=1 Tax=Saccostrea echinata TaxID=191078 RepID=UPI002A82FE17|nr:uncharacterized protein LOC133195484 isoform X2 [Saccostrea echinata]
MTRIFYRSCLLIQSAFRRFELRSSMGNPKVHFHSSPGKLTGLHLKDVDRKLPVHFKNSINQECLSVKTNIPSDNEHLVVYLMKGIPTLTLQTGCGFRLNQSENTLSVSVHSIDKQKAREAVKALRRWLEKTVEIGIQKHAYNKNLHLPFTREIPALILNRALTQRGHDNIKAIGAATGTRITYSPRGVKQPHVMVHADSYEKMWEAVDLTKKLFDQTVNHLRNCSVGKLMIPDNLPADFDVYCFAELLKVVLTEKYGESQPIVTLCWNVHKTKDEEAYAYYDIRAETSETVEEVKSLILRMLEREVERFKYQAHDTVFYPPEDEYRKFTKLMNTVGLHLLNDWRTSDSSLKNIRLHFKGDQQRREEAKMTGNPQRHRKIHIRGDNLEDVQKVAQKINKMIKNYTDVYIH